MNMDNENLTITITGPRGRGKTTLANCLHTILVELYRQRVTTKSHSPPYSQPLHSVPSALYNKNITIDIIDLDEPNKETTKL